MRLYMKPSGHWAVDFEDPTTGARRRVSTGLRDKKEAAKKARDIVLGVERPAQVTEREPAKPAGTTMDALWHRCELTVWSPREARSQRTIKSNLKVLRRVEVNGVVFSTMLVPTITYSTLEALAGVLLGMGYAPGTVKRKMDMVGKSLTMASKWEIIIARPAMPSFKVENKRERVLADLEEVEVFKAVAARREREPVRDWHRFGLLLRFLLDVGCRLGEAQNVRLGDIELIDMGETRQWVVHFRRYETKNGKPRTIPLTKAVADMLPTLRLLSVRGVLFPISSGTAWYMWNTIRDDVGGMDDVVLHTMRHTCITRLAKRLPIHIVSQWAGHADIKITASVYTHLDTSDLLQALPVLSRSG